MGGYFTPGIIKGLSYNYFSCRKTHFFLKLSAFSFQLSANALNVFAEC